MGQIVDINYLTNEILAIEGVETFYTRRIDNKSIRYEGLSMLVWNPVYEVDNRLITQNIIMSYFQIPYLYDRENFTNKITVESINKVYENIEF